MEKLWYIILLYLCCKKYYEERNVCKKNAQISSTGQLLIFLIAWNEDVLFSRHSNVR